MLRVFWEKRSREKEDWGTRLRPTEKPKPGKAMFNWRPTRDLRRPWRAALFVWAMLIVGAIGVFAYFKRPTRLRARAAVESARYAIRDDDDRRHVECQLLHDLSHGKPADRQRVHQVPHG